LGKFEQWTNYLREWHNNIQLQQHFYISQQTQVIHNRNYGVCTKCQFHEESVIFKQHMFDKIDCGYSFSFDVSQYFVALISMIFSNLVKSKSILRLLMKWLYKHCKRCQR
jgi:hypothetical protein